MKSKPSKHAYYLSDPQAYNDIEDMDTKADKREKRITLYGDFVKRAIKGLSR